MTCNDDQLLPMHDATAASAAEKINQQRVARAALGEMLSATSAQALSPIVIGSLVVLVRHAVARVDFGARGSTMQAKEAQSALAMKGVGASDSDLVLAGLEMAGLIRLEAGVLAIPGLDAALRSELSSLSNRMAGWVKRSGARVAPTGGAPAIAADAAAKHEAAAAQVDGISADGVAAPAAPAIPAAAAPRTKRPAQVRAEGGVEVRRFSSSDKVATDPQSDPVFVRIPCKGDAVAEVTADYVADLRQSYRSLDIEEQLLRCRAWCQAQASRRKTLTGFRKFINRWMNSAARDHDMAQSFRRAEASRNGFGQGGGYPFVSAPADHGAAPLDVASGEQEEFDDLLGDPIPTQASLLEPPASMDVVAAPVVAPAPAPAPKPTPSAADPLPASVASGRSSAVLAARARLYGANTRMSARSKFDVRPS